MTPRLLGAEARLEKPVDNIISPCKNSRPLVSGSPSSWRTGFATNPRNSNVCYSCLYMKQSVLACRTRDKHATKSWASGASLFGPFSIFFVVHSAHPDIGKFRLGLPRGRSSSLARRGFEAPSTWTMGSWTASNTLSACPRRWGLKSPRLSPALSSPGPRQPDAAGGGKEGCRRLATSLFEDWMALRSAATGRQISLQYSC